MRRAALFLAVASTTLFTSAMAQQDHAAPRGIDLKHDLARMQGRWTRTAEISAGTGKTEVIVKEIAGNIETYTVLRDGKVTFAQRVEITLEAAGPVRLFTFRNAVIVGGPDKGKPATVREGAYIYRFFGDRWYQSNGLLDDPREVFKNKEPRLVVWTRTSTAAK
jgi:hypothetical protein